MITPAKLLTLAVITAVAVGAAVFSVQRSTATSSQSERGNDFLPGLIGKANTADQVVVTDGTVKTIIKKEGDSFVHDSGYPVRGEAVGNLLTSLALLTVEERKTDKPDLYPDLELAPPDAEDGNGRQVTVLAGSEILADLIVGTADFSVGGTRGGVYARNATEPPAYLLRGNVAVPGTAAGWFDTQAYKFDPASILTAQIKPATGLPVRLAQSGTSKTLVLDQLPQGAAADPTKIQRVAALASELSFENVRKASGKPSGHTLTTVTNTQFRYIVQGIDKMDPENAWVTIRVEPDSVKATAKANEANQRFDGFEFKISRSNAEMFAWTVADLLKAPEPAAPGGASGLQIPGLAPTPK